MSTSVFMTLVERLSEYNINQTVKHPKIITAARELMSSPLFKEQNGLFTLTPIETSKLPVIKYPDGLYSLEGDIKRTDMRYVAILRLDEYSHLYLKIMLDAGDYSATRFRLAYVTYKGFPVTHHDLENGTIWQIKNHLKKQGIEL